MKNRSHCSHSTLPSSISSLQHFHSHAVTHLFTLCLLLFNFLNVRVEYEILSYTTNFARPMQCRKLIVFTWANPKYNQEFYKNVKFSPLHSMLVFCFRCSRLRILCFFRRNAIAAINIVTIFLDLRRATNIIKLKWCAPLFFFSNIAFNKTFLDLKIFFTYYYNSLSDVMKVTHFIVIDYLSFNVRERERE